MTISCPLNRKSIYDNLLYDKITGADFAFEKNNNILNWFIYLIDIILISMCHCWHSERVWLSPVTDVIRNNFDRISLGDYDLQPSSRTIGSTYSAKYPHSVQYIFVVILNWKGKAHHLKHLLLKYCLCF